MSDALLDSDRVREFHASGCRCVLAVTGGGSALVSELLSVPGGSSSVLEAVVPYHTEALAEFLRHRPDQFCSRETSLMMAATALEHARHLCGNPLDGVVGVGITASLRSSAEKRGEHRAYVAIQTPQETRLLHQPFAKGVLTRREEEQATAIVAFEALYETVVRRASGQTSPAPISERWPAAKFERASADQAWQDVRAKRTPYAIVPAHANDELAAVLPTALLSGSFNPLHHGHQRLRDAAARVLGVDVGFEIPITNADKPPIDDISLRARLDQFSTPVVITSSPTFADKALHMPDTTFVVGVDTAARILDSRFYPSGTRDDALARIAHQRCRFLVAARHDAGEVLTLSQLPIPEQFNELFIELPSSEFLEDISSTTLRQRRRAE